MATVTDPDKTTSYTYDDNGNIKTITSAGNLITYIYNEISELIREDNQVLNKTITYRYDGGGNLLEKKEYAYTTGTPGASTRTLPYGYADTNWKDKLTSFDGKAITYDTIGNPLSYDGWTYTWEEGRQLKSMTKGTTALSFKYNSSGLRTEKSVNGVPTKYTYLGGKVAFETTGAETFHYTYDGKGAPFSMTYHGSEYFYLTNLQGDVTGLADAAGVTVVSYSYDSWGKLISTTGSMATTLGVKNPYRYRGYRYDTETGLYYLQSRYYNPEIGRFINADDASILKLTILGVTNHNNLFTYCSNNPGNSSDSTGFISTWDIAWIVADAIFTAAGFGWLLKLKSTTIALYWGVRIGIQFIEYFQARNRWLSVKAQNNRDQDRKFNEYRIGQFSAIGSSIFSVVSALIPVKSVGKSVAKAVAHAIAYVFGPSLGSISTIITVINSK